MSIALREGHHFYRRAAVQTSAALVDARAYYRAFYQAALAAEQYLLIAGWQFDSEVALLRGDDAEGAPLPVTFLPFLDALCARRPALRIYILAWDYSFVYALEREWLQELKFAVGTPGALRFEFDTHPRADGSHHQKFVVIDGQLAFAGGMDICDARWDDRGHTAQDPLRVNVAGEPHRANHEVQAAVVGDAATALAELFCDRWRTACDEELVLPAGPVGADFDLAELSGGAALPLRARDVYLSRTGVAADGTPVTEILAACEDALRGAERLVYVENQYFTSRSIAAALLERLHAPDAPKLSVVIVLPKGADSGKEKFALGEAQGNVLGALEAAARAHGHELVILCSACGDDDERTTFIHSKLLAVDDRFLSIGSANFTERSMAIDTELALSWHAEPHSELADDIAQLRASLLAEHAGCESAALLPIAGLFQRVMALVSNPDSRLQACHYEPQAANPLKTLIFDPGGPLTLPELEERADGE